MLEWVSKVDEVSFDHFKRTNLEGKIVLFCPGNSILSKPRHVCDGALDLRKVLKSGFFFLFILSFLFWGELEGMGGEAIGSALSFFKFYLTLGEESVKR